MTSFTIKLKPVTGAQLKAHIDAEKARIDAALRDKELVAAFRVIAERKDLTPEDVAELFRKIKGGCA